MSVVPQPLRDLATGVVIVTAVLLVVRLVDSDAWTWAEHWMLLPIGAGLFMMRQSVRRMVLARVEARQGGGAPEGSAPTDPLDRPPKPTGRRLDDVAKVAGLVALGVLGLLVLVVL